MTRPGKKIIQAKLVLLGDMGTGKTSLVLRFVKGQFFDCQEPTVGAAFFTQILSLTEATVKFDIWDTAGQERYHSLAPMYYRGASSAIIAYDISCKDTFRRAKKWVQELQKQGSPNLVMALVANKCDLGSIREVSNEEGEQFSQESGMFFIETSAKTSFNINELFYEIAKRLARENTLKSAGLNLNDETQSRRKLPCCSGTSVTPRQSYPATQGSSRAKEGIRGAYHKGKGTKAHDEANLSRLFQNITRLSRDVEDIKRALIHGKVKSRHDLSEKWAHRPNQVAKRVKNGIQPAKNGPARESVAKSPK